METIAVQLSIPKPLYQQLEQTARLTQCDVQEVIVSALETLVSSLPEHLSQEDTAEIARLALLDDETLQTIAEAFLPPAQHRRFTSLLRKEETGRLRPGEREEWQRLQHAYLRLSHTKARAQFHS